MADSHRWPRATIADDRWGPLCECGNLKTDQALTCTECAAERRRAPDFWERRTCECGGAKSKRGRRCLRCEHDRRRAEPSAWDFGGSSRGAADHPWRAGEKARLAA